jgi:hypothetical protein
MTPVTVASAVVPGGRAVEAVAPRLLGVGCLTGWGEGLAVVPAGPQPVPAALLTVPTPALAGERFRRATRECLLAVAAVRASLADAGLEEGDVAGSRTGIVYATATAYAAANRAFLEDEGSATLHFPYTAPSAVPGEVTIALGIRGPYLNLMGGGPAALEALWTAARWLATGQADRVLVLAVEAVHEVWDLFARARRLYARPLVEGAVCLVLEPGGAGPLRWASGAAAPGRGGRAAVGAVLGAVLGDTVPSAVTGCPGDRRFARAERDELAARGAPAIDRGPGEALACGPLIGLGRGRAGEGSRLLTAAWRNDYGAMLWPG